jgi:quercetin dioxygenase-like cupin family protein
MAPTHGEGTQRAGLTGSTHGGQERTARRLTAPLLSFDLAQEAEQLRKEANWAEHGHNAKTLVKEQAYRLVLIAMRQGALLSEHVVPGPLSIQVVRGQVQVVADERTVGLSAGQLLVLDDGVPHAVTALAESEFVLTIAADGYGGPGPAAE